MAPKFILLTAAKNEAAYIGKTIESVSRQTVLPTAWFIVDDGSSDRTAEIIAGYAACYPFIKLRCRPANEGRNFGAKSIAINAVYQEAMAVDFDFVAIHDADIELPLSRYFECLLCAFDAEPALGISGGYIHERCRGEWKPRPSNSPAAVAGAVQFFRRSCFPSGYTPLKCGGEDWLAQLDAESLGWRARSQTDLPAYHHRPTSSADGYLRGLFRLGIRDASFGSHPLFQVVKCVRRFREQPYVIAGLIRYAGYVWYVASGAAPILPIEKISYLRDQQVKRLRALVQPSGSSALDGRI